MSYIKHILNIHGTAYITNLRIRCRRKGHKGPTKRALTHLKKYKGKRCTLYVRITDKQNHAVWNPNTKTANSATENFLFNIQQEVKY